MFHGLFGYTLVLKIFRSGRLNELEKVKKIVVLCSYFISSESNETFSRASKTCWRTMQLSLKTKIGLLGPLNWLSVIQEVRDMSMEKVHFTMLTSRSVLTLTSATKVSQLTFSIYFVFNTMRQEFWCGSGAWKWETRCEEPISTSQTSGFWPKMVFIIVTKWWCPGSFFDVDNTFH